MPLFQKIQLTFLSPGRHSGVTIFVRKNKLLAVHSTYLAHHIQKHSSKHCSVAAWFLKILRY